MTKPLKPGKHTVELNGPARPSRIRRDPPPRPGGAAGTDQKLQWNSSEREIWLAIIGIVAFALAINAVVVGISALTN